MWGIGGWGVSWWAAALVSAGGDGELVCVTAEDRTVEVGAESRTVAAPVDPKC